jgi:uncharacterized repeat protein (TIGR01451 family)
MNLASELWWVYRLVDCSGPSKCWSQEPRREESDQGLIKVPTLVRCRGMGSICSVESPIEKENTLTRCKAIQLKDRLSKQLARSVAGALALALVLPGTAALAAGGGGTGADVQISGSASTGSPTAGTPFTYTFQVRNSGPSTATATVFTDALPAGFSFSSAYVNRMSNTCSGAPDASGSTVVSCNLFDLASGAQSVVDVNVTAPLSAGSFPNTGTASSSVSDPQPANNSVTVTVKAATCALPTGQSSLNGMVMGKFYDAQGFLQSFTLQVGGVTYLVVANFFDGTRPLTQVINLTCKTVPANLYIQPGTSDTVFGTLGTATLPGSTAAVPAIYASLVQTPFLVDKVA